MGRGQSPFKTAGLEARLFRLKILGMNHLYNVKAKEVFPVESPHRCDALNLHRRHQPRALRTVKILFLL